MHFLYGNSNFIASFILLVFFNFCPINFAEKQTNSPPSFKNPPKSIPSASKVPATLPPSSANSSKCSSPPQNSTATKEPYRILILYAPDTPSHLGAMKPMINRLASAGHQVHILCITSQEKREKHAKNVQEIRIQIGGDFDREKGIAELATLIWNHTLHSPLLPLIYQKFSKAFDDLLTQHSTQLTEVINAKWDLLIFDELFTIHGYVLAELFHKNRRVPYLVYCTSIMMGASSWANANAQHWAIHPAGFVPTPSNAKDGFEPGKFTNRLVNVMELFGDLVSSGIIDNFHIAPQSAKLTGKSDFSFSKLYAKSEMSMLSSIAHLAFPQAEVTEVLNVGAHCDASPPQLPEDYREFMEDPLSKGTIYVAFGTIIPWDYAPTHVVQAFLDAFERLPDYRIIFSFNGKFPSGKLSSHIRLVKWAPQSAVLSHPKTKVFLTHCGLKSIKESLCSKTPMLAMPVFAEQNHNARLVVEMGIGIALNKYSIGADELHSSLNELLNNDKYARRVEKLQKIFLDKPIDELDHGEFYIRRIMEKKETRMGKFFFKRKGIHLNWFQHFYIDLAIAFFSAILLISFK